ncbi:MAG: metallophosphoesterase [Phaeodactylibacter sp.]|nr:metallophosphoesterase [Phaeodactylibacter sp.]
MFRLSEIPSVAVILLSVFVLPGCTAPKTTFYAFADLPYKEKEVEKLKDGVEAINRDDDYDFSIHLGDIKAGKDPCNLEYYTQASGILKRINKTTFIIPGDNEWNDCQDPDSAWQLWEQHFMAFEQNWPGRTLKVRHQPSRKENFAFVHRKCLFIGLNLVGGKVHDKEEREQRLADDAEWMRRNFDEYGKKVKCAIVFGHAQPVFDKEDPNQVFFDALKTEAEAFGKPLLFMHGDGHELELERFLAPNLLRFELNGGKESDWLMKVVVEPRKPQPFTFQLPVPGA